MDEDVRSSVIVRSFDILMQTAEAARSSSGYGIPVRAYPHSGSRVSGASKVDKGVLLLGFNAEC